MTDTFKIHNANEKTIKAIETLLEALDVVFDHVSDKKKNSSAKKEKPYNPEFVAKILESQQQYKDGKYTAIKTEDLWK